MNKGFIQIPLAVIIVGSIVVASIGAGLILYKSGKLSNLGASISNVFKNKNDAELELEKARLDTEKAKQENALLQIEIEKQKQSQAPVPQTPEPSQIKEIPQSSRSLLPKTPASQSPVPVVVSTPSPIIILTPSQTPAPVITPTPTPIPVITPTPAPSVDQTQIILEILRKQKEQEQEAARIAAEQEAQRLQDELTKKQALIAQMKSECDDPINQLKQQSLTIKSDYYVKVAEIKNKLASMSSINGQIAKLTDDTNAQLAQINNQISQIALQCSIKYGN